MYRVPAVPVGAAVNGRGHQTPARPRARFPSTHEQCQYGATISRIRLGHNHNKTVLYISFRHKTRVSRLASYLGPPYTKTPNGLAQRVDETPNEPKPRGSAVRLASRQAHGAGARGVRGTRGYRGPSRLNNTPHRMAHRAGGTISKATPPCPPTAKCQPSWLWCWARARVSASRPARTLS
jgi:hypothetical protein